MLLLNFYLLLLQIRFDGLEIAVEFFLHAIHPSVLQLNEVVDVNQVVR